jgi:hypothetical protein
MKNNDGKDFDQVAGVKEVGMKDLTYRLVFIANSIQSQDSKGSSHTDNTVDDEEENYSVYKKQFTEEDYLTSLKIKE